MFHIRQCGTLKCSHSNRIKSNQNVSFKIVQFVITVRSLYLHTELVKNWFSFAKNMKKLPSEKFSNTSGDVPIASIDKNVNRSG